MDFIRDARLALKAEFAPLLVGVIFVVYAGTYQLTDSPAIWYDEGFYTQLAMNLAEGRGQVLQIAPETFVSAAGVTAGYPLVGPVALSYRVFGTGVLQGRIVMVIFLVLFIGVVYALARALFGIWDALLALAVIATYPVLYGNGKSVLGEVPGLFFLVLTLLALVWLERSDWRDWRAYALTGCAAGMCVATKPIFIMLGPAGIIPVLVASRVRALSLRGVLITVSTFAMPIIAWFFMQFGPGDSLASVLSFYANPYEYTTVGIAPMMLSNAWRFLTELSPLYTLAFIVMWGAGLFARVHKKERISVAEWVALAFSLFVLFFFLRTPGWYRYFFPATMMALLFAPRALRTTFELAANRTRFSGYGAWAAGMVVLALASIQIYQLRWDSWVASYYGSTRTEDVQAYLSSISHSEIVFLYNVPEVAILLPSRNYHQYLIPHPGQIIGGEELSLIEKGGADLVIINRETYENNTAPFAKYRVRGTVSRYAILESL